MKFQREIPIDKAELVLARKNANMINPSIEIDSSGNIVPRSIDSSADYTVMVRKATNDPLKNRPAKAKSLRACKGLKGCEFAECAKKVFGKLPRNLEKLESTCSTEKRSNSLENINDS